MASLWCLLLAPSSGALGFSMLAKQFERKRTGRSGRVGTGRMRHDGVRDGAVSGGSRIGVQDLLAKSIRDSLGSSANVHEDALVGEGRDQPAPVRDADRRVERDRLPDPVDVALVNAVAPEDGSSQIGALDLESSLAGGAVTEPKIVHQGGREEQVLVVAVVIQ